MAQKSILADTPTNLINKFTQALRDEGIPVDKMILFGLYAKGNYKPWSDLDVCVVSAVFGKNAYDEQVRLVHIAAEIDPMIEPYPYNPRDLRNPYDPLAAEIRSSGKTM